MATLTIRNLPEDVKARLRIEAAARGRSMEEEARLILAQALCARGATVGALGRRIHARFAALGDAGLELPARTERPRAAELPE